jgi:hypothetical protein
MLDDYIVVLHIFLLLSAYLAASSNIEQADIRTYIKTTVSSNLIQKALPALHINWQLALFPPISLQRSHTQMLERSASWQSEQGAY